MSNAHNTDGIKEAIRKGSTYDFSGYDITRSEELERKFNRYYKRLYEGPVARLTTNESLTLNKRCARLCADHPELTYIACLCLAHSEGL